MQGDLHTEDIDFSVRGIVFTHKCVLKDILLKGSLVISCLVRVSILKYVFEKFGSLCF